NMQTYFCDAHSPWQKGGVENAISRLRRPLPRKTDLTALGAHGLQAAVENYNSTPRKCLDFKTPAEVFAENLQALHFNRESIHPPSRA
ncbi:MAG: IS30 family transposase, partial [Pseudomonadota bacterium]